MLRAFDGGHIATKGGAAEREKQCVFFIRITLLSLLGISWLSSTQDGVKAQTCACGRHFGFSVLNDQLLIISPQMYNNDGGTADPNDEIPTYKKKKESSDFLFRNNKEFAKVLLNLVVCLG